MIDAISPQGKYMYVHGGHASNYINGYSGAQGVGNVRFNTTNQRLEVFDGNNWMALQMSTAMIGLNPEAESLLDWAKKKREEEETWQKLAQENKAVEIALHNLHQAQEQLNITAKLVREHDTTTTS